MPGSLLFIKAALMTCIPERDECFLMNPSQSNISTIMIITTILAIITTIITFITILTSYEYSYVHHVCCDQG